MKKKIFLNFLFFALMLNLYSSVKLKISSNEDVYTIDEDNSELITYIESLNDVISKINSFEKKRNMTGFKIDKNWNLTDEFNNIKIKSPKKKYVINDDDEESKEVIVEEEKSTDEEIEDIYGKNISIKVINTTYYLSDNFNKTPLNEIVEIATKEIKKLLPRIPAINKFKKNITTYISNLEKQIENINDKYDNYIKEKEHIINEINLKILEDLKIQLLTEINEVYDTINSEKEELSHYNILLENLSNQQPSISSICSLLNNCDACTGNPYCGWCASSNLCVEGDEHSPKLGQCSYYNYDKCSDKSNCEYLNCNDCLGDSGCGWCNNISPVCIRKNDAESGLCRKDLFYHVWDKDNNKCPDINVFNFLDYINNKLEKSSEIIIQEPDLHLNAPIVNHIEKEIDELNEKMINNTLQINTLTKDYENKKKRLKDIEKEEIKMKVMSKWNDTISKEIFENTMNDMKNILIDFILNEDVIDENTEINEEFFINY